MPEIPRFTAIPRLLGAGLLVLILTGPAAAQDPLGEPASNDTVPPDDVFAEMQTQLERLLPAMRELARSLQDALPELDADGAAQPDMAAVAQRAARFTRAYYEALLAEGFTREEALRIVSGGAPPGR